MCSDLLRNDGKLAHSGNRRCVEINLGTDRMVLFYWACVDSWLCACNHKRGSHGPGFHLPGPGNWHVSTKSMRDPAENQGRLELKNVPVSQRWLWWDCPQENLSVFKYYRRDCTFPFIVAFSCAKTKNKCTLYKVKSVFFISAKPGTSWSLHLQADPRFHMKAA